MNVFLGSDTLIEPTNKNVLRILSTQTISASDLNFYNGQVLGFILVDGGTASYGGRVNIGSVTITNSTEDLVCTVGGYEGLTSIAGLGFNKISASMTYIPKGSGSFQGIYGLGSGSSSGIADAPNTGKQGNSANTGLIILYY